MDKTSNDPVRSNGHARAVQRPPTRRARSFSWTCARVVARGGAQRRRSHETAPRSPPRMPPRPCTRQVVQRALARRCAAGEENDVHGPPALSPTVYRARGNGAGGVVGRAPRTGAWCGETALLAIPAGCLRCLRFQKLFGRNRRQRRCLARFPTFLPSPAHLAAAKTRDNNRAHTQSGTIPVSTCYGDTEGTITIYDKDLYTPHTSIICILRSSS